MNSEILIGTSGYSYADWVGPVYPDGTAAKDYLATYAKTFSFVEINYSYYRFPVPATFERMVCDTESYFKFSVKAHRSLTHEISANYNESIKLFRDALKPLSRKGRLVALLLQFPFSFHYTADARRYLLALCKGFSGIPLAFEFRNAEWQKESVYRGLTEYNASFVNTDLPPLPGLPHPTWVATAPLAYFRFHGRNSELWWSGDNASRYDYLYSENELSDAAWRMDLSFSRNEPKTVIVAFNNHWKGQAVTNAIRMRELLAGHA